MIFWCRIVLVNGWDDLYMFVFCEREIPNLKNQNAIFEISIFQLPAVRKNNNRPDF